MKKIIKMLYFFFLFISALLVLFYYYGWKPIKIKMKPTIKKFLKNENQYKEIYKLLTENPNITIFLKVEKDRYRLNEKFYNQKKFIKIVNKNLIYSKILSFIIKNKLEGISNNKYCIEFIKNSGFELYYGILIIKDKENFNWRKYSLLKRIYINTYFFVGH